ncbi:MAG: DUF2605 domain-containing protein [Cyanobacteriota bacterium]|nr:DUF2605 domain-containing protein [Cyanobacteriota bacterium]
MSLTEPPEKELLKTILEPLLEDFQYWFSRSQTLLESERLTFLSPQEQDHLLSRLKEAQQEVGAAKMLFRATDGSAGIDPATLKPWHRLVGECWQVSRKWRSVEKQQQQE